MLNITHYQRNANQNHNEVPLHASQDGCYPKVYKQEMLERVWRKGNPLTLLVRMQTSAATMENSVEISFTSFLPLVSVYVWTLLLQLLVKMIKLFILL